MGIIKSPAWVSLIWFGMTAGISMLAVTAVSRPIGLDVGSPIFAALNRAEFVALIIMLILIRVSDHSRQFLLPAAMLALILIAQAAWLLPELATRNDSIITGAESGPSMAISVYPVLELTKLILLVYLGFRSLQMLATGQQFRE